MSVVCSCAEFDATSIWDEINGHEDRIARLEQLCAKLNCDIAAQKSIIMALQSNDYVVNIAPIMEAIKRLAIPLLSLRVVLSQSTMAKMARTEQMALMEKTDRMELMV